MKYCSQTSMRLANKDPGFVSVYAKGRLLPTLKEPRYYLRFLRSFGMMPSLCGKTYLSLVWEKFGCRIYGTCTCNVNKPHDGVIKWKHYPRYWPFVWEIHQSPVNSNHKGQWRGALMFLWSAPKQTTGQTIVGLAIWDAIALFMTSP